MKITINKEVFRKFHPKFKVAFILLKDMDNSSKIQDSYHLLKEAEQLIRLTFNKDTVKNHHLISPWVSAQQEFGSKAKHYHTSVERLLKTVLKKREVTSRNVTSNIVNYISLKHIVPMAVDDYDKLVGRLSFRLADGLEKPNILKVVKPGSLIYTDLHKGNNLLGTKLDYWKSSRTKLLPSSKNALVHIECLPPITTKQFNHIVKETAGLLKVFTGAKIKRLVLDKNKNSGEI